jgi:hypothetical protein
MLFGVDISLNPIFYFSELIKALTTLTLNLLVIFATQNIPLVVVHTWCEGRGTRQINPYLTVGLTPMNILNLERLDVELLDLSFRTMLQNISDVVVALLRNSSFECTFLGGKDLDLRP